MYVPITSEVNLETGMTLLEISTERLYTITERLKKSKEVLGDSWEITPVDTLGLDRLPKVLATPELSERYFAEVED
jgi:hypothetical protein